MQIFINNKLAALKKGTSFEYISENRLFSGSDDYTLTITFPLRGCPENIDIFGHIDRADVAAQKVIFDCELRDKGFYRFGSITITEISESEVKTQFLEGRSEQNFDKTFDEVYINELDLGAAPVTSPNQITPSEAWNPEKSGCKYVALPWVNDYSGNIQNLAEYVVDNAAQKTGHYVWNNTECKGLSWQPYLLYIIEKICEAIDYTYDLTELYEKEEYKYLLICNALPYAWDIANFARALPHWTVTEFFEKLELFLEGEFTINHRAKTIDFAFTEKTLRAIEPVWIDELVDEHTVDVTVEEEKCEYRELKNLVYKECDNEMWKFYSCDWFIRGWKQDVIKYDTLTELLKENKWLATLNMRGGRGTNLNKLLYAADVDAYFLIRALSKELIEERSEWIPNLYKYKMELRPVNLFGGRIVDDSDDADEIEIEFVPAWVDETDEKYGRCLFLSFSGYDETDSTGASFSRDPMDVKLEVDATIFQPIPLQALIAGEKTKKDEYYDLIYMAWWDGARASDGPLPHPYVEEIEIAADWSNYRLVHSSMRINDKLQNRQREIHKINPMKKSRFKFLSGSIPNPRAVFYIKGKKYLCEKITATFTENGMTNLLTGIFYPIVD